MVWVQQLLHPQGSTFPDGSSPSPPSGKHIPASSLHMGAEIKPSCWLTKGAVHLAGAAKEFQDLLGPNSQVSEVRVLIPKPAFL